MSSFKMYDGDEIATVFAQLMDVEDTPKAEESQQTAESIKTVEDPLEPAELKSEVVMQLIDLSDSADFEGKVESALLIDKAINKIARSIAK